MAHGGMDRIHDGQVPMKAACPGAAGERRQEVARVMAEPRRAAAPAADRGRGYRRARPERAKSPTTAARATRGSGGLWSSRFILRSRLIVQCSK
jgi:hypothetical protein